MATITPITGQSANSNQTQRIDSPGTDNIARTRSTETVRPEENAAEAVQKSEQTESTPAGREEKAEDTQNTPERDSTFIANA